jgi:hypothetical protein
MVAVMEAVIQPPNVAHHQRAAFHASTQGECDLNIYVQELRQRRASMAANAIAEDVMVTVFMDNMKAGPAMIALSREEPTTLVEAFAIALLEDHVQTCTRSSGPADSWLCDGVAYVAAPAEAMYVSLLHLSQVDLTAVDLAAIDVNALHIKCFTCSKVGRFQRNWPRNRASRPAIL